MIMIRSLDEAYTHETGHAIVAHALGGTVTTILIGRGRDRHIRDAASALRGSAAAKVGDFDPLGVTRWSGLNDLDMVVALLAGGVAAHGAPSEQDMASARHHAGLVDRDVDKVLDRAQEYAARIIRREQPKLDALVAKLKAHHGVMAGAELDEFFRQEDVMPQRSSDDIVPDGHVVHVTPAMLDSVQRAVFADAMAREGRPLVVDATGQAAGNRPGFAFSAIDDGRKEAAETAYAERRERISTAWRSAREHHDDDRRGSPSLADAQKAAADAREQRIERMRNAYKGAVT
jgi:hypothetical protein